MFPNNRSLPLTVALMALLIVLAAIFTGRVALQGDGSLLRNVTFATTEITPNADGDNDITLIQYELSRNATISIYFDDPAGTRYYFRQERERGKGTFQLYFSGVVNGYLLPDETIEGKVISRLLQNGEYQWTIAATDSNGHSEQVSGRITISQADLTLPQLLDFSLDKNSFTPNRDGINDRVQAQYFLPKEATVRLFLRLPNGLELPIAEKNRDVPAGEPGWHIYDYEGGVDNGDTPPPNGTYPIVAIAEDAEGQKIEVESQLTIDLGGVPRAQILPAVVGDTLEFNTLSISLCNTLSFTITVQNYGETPIRTVGPWSGTAYDSTWNYNTVGWPTESGAWRLGIGYENALSDYPYRWGLGTPDQLTEIDGHYYLMPGQQVAITGYIRVVDLFGVRNPQPIWAGLIHEDVEISQFNNRVDPHAILVDLPDPAHIPICEPK